MRQLIPYRGSLAASSDVVILFDLNKTPHTCRPSCASAAILSTTSETNCQTREKPRTIL